MRESAGHYERAFDQYLRERRAAFVRVDEARRLLAPPDKHRRGTPPESAPALKYFDYVVYTPGANLLVELKGRRLGAVVRGGDDSSAGVRASARMECWVTREDITSMLRWQTLFGSSFAGVIVFVYQCLCEPPDSLFQDVLARGNRWYAFRAVRASDYAREMKVRSPRWGTVDLAPESFARISSPISALIGLDSHQDAMPPNTPEPHPHPSPDPDSLLNALGVPFPR